MTKLDDFRTATQRPGQIPTAPQETTNLVLIQAYAHFEGNDCVITTTRTYGSQSMQNRYRLTVLDDDSIQFFGDVSPAFREMLFGMTRSMINLRRHGFDREP